MTVSARAAFVVAADDETTSRLGRLLIRRQLCAQGPVRLRLNKLRSPFVFHPLYHHDDVVVLGRLGPNKTLCVAFYDAANQQFLPALTPLEYKDRLNFIGRRTRRRFVAQLVADARKQEALAIV
jgi:hypothetical protein